MRNYSRFIPGEEIDAVQQWQFGALDTAAQLLAAQVVARQEQASEQQAEVQRQESFQAGFTQGLVQGRAQAQAELQQQMAEFLANQSQQAAERFAELLAAAQLELSQARQVMAEGVLDLSCELARQVLRQELSVNPHVLEPVIHEALELLGAEHRSAVIRLNPSDMATLGEALTGAVQHMDISLRADANLEPGSCVVESAGMVVDATLQKRWQRAVATLGLSSVWETPHEPS
jgi:flagellar assembly protein FliH